jgi:hypothetical protein
VTEGEAIGRQDVIMVMAVRVKESRQRRRRHDLTANRATRVDRNLRLCLDYPPCVGHHCQRKERYNNPILMECQTHAVLRTMEAPFYAG